jgi:hypothetical protein
MDIESLARVCTEEYFNEDCYKDDIPIEYRLTEEERKELEES